MPGNNSTDDTGTEKQGEWMETAENLVWDLGSGIQRICAEVKPSVYVPYLRLRPYNVHHLSSPYMIMWAMQETDGFAINVKRFAILPNPQPHKHVSIDS
jgi:hypothetical protein